MSETYCILNINVFCHHFDVVFHTIYLLSLLLFVQSELRHQLFYIVSIVLVQDSQIQKWFWIVGTQWNRQLVCLLGLVQATHDPIDDSQVQPQP